MGTVTSMAAAPSRDRRGLDVTASSAAALEALDRFQENLLRGHDAAGGVLAAAEAHPDCVLLQAGAAALHLYSQATAEIETQARPFLRRAAAAGGHPRERLFVAALGAWADNDFWGALTRLEQLTAEWPQDLLAAKIAEMLYFMTGQTRCAPFLAMTERMAPAHPRSAPFLAIHSFALELNGQPARALERARAALTLEDNLAWAQHTLQHLYLNGGQIADGLPDIAARSRRWGESGRGPACHNWWHLALLHLAANDTAAALAVYRERIWGVQPENVFELTDAISLLWRVELAGADCAREWAAIAPHARRRAEDMVFPFLSAHLCYALARAGAQETARQAVARLAQRAARLPPGSARRAWADVGLPLLRGVTAFAVEDYAASFRELQSVAGRWTCVGGSDAQNDLFDQTFLAAALRGGENAVARQLWEARTAARAPWPLEETWRPG